MNEQEYIKDYEEIDWKDLFLYLKSKATLILLITFIGFSGSIIYSLSLKDLYSSNAVLKVASEKSISSNSSSLGGFSSLSSLTGIQLGQSSDSNFAKYFLASRAFLLKIAQFPDVKRNLFAAKSYDRSIGIIYDSSIFDVSSDSWVPNNSFAPSDLQTYSALANRLTITQDIDTGFINIGFSHYSPIYAKEMIDLIITEANEISRLKALDAAENSLTYLNAELNQTTKIDLQRSINLLIDGALQKKMMANVNKEYLLEVIDPPYIPEHKSSPNRGHIVIISTILSLLMSLILFTVYKFTILRK